MNTFFILIEQASAPYFILIHISTGLSTFGCFTLFGGYALLGGYDKNSLGGFDRDGVGGIYE